MKLLVSNVLKLGGLLFAFSNMVLAGDFTLGFQSNGGEDHRLSPKYKIEIKYEERGRHYQVLERFKSSWSLIRLWKYPHILPSARMAGESL
jgi:hypothetical protein